MIFNITKTRRYRKISVPTSIDISLSACQCRQHKNSTIHYQFISLS